MAKLAETRAKSPQVKDLAMKIMEAQNPEIQMMSGWLNDWGKPVPQDMSGMDMSGSMPGMMSTDDMTMLKEMSGPGFDQHFLQMMIWHHQGAIRMANIEIVNGRNVCAQSLARQIETDQRAEIMTMKGLLE